MALKDELDQYVKDTFSGAWAVTDGQVVPSTADIGLANVGRRLDATVLYADLAHSTQLVEESSQEFAAEVYKSYLYCASRLIRNAGGTITAFDGDRVMGVFVGNSKNTSAAKCALNINWAVTKLIQPALQQSYPKYPYVVRQKVGIDSSGLLVVRAGVRGDNDLVWVGMAANNAAKMAALDVAYSSYISATAYEMLHESAKYSAEKKSMWTALGSAALGYPIYGSTWFWAP